jgi:hypothetical protein
MKFVPVAGTKVLFDIWDTRVEDFRAFVESANYEVTGDMWSLGKDAWKQRGATWNEPGFKQSGNITMATLEPARLEASLPIKTDCTISEATFGSGVKIGTIRKWFTECCAVRPGIRATQFSSDPLLATTSRQTITVLSSDFVAF